MFLNTSIKISIVSHNETASFMPVPTKNERNEPQPLRTARFLSLLSFINSPSNAPTNGPTIMPTGPKMKPARTPAIAPRSPAFEPPNFLVIYDGST